MGGARITVGTVLAGRYRVDELLRRGGMGELWRCHDLEQQRDIAAKVVRREFLAEPWAARLFHGEVAAVARLDHPGIIPVYDLLTDAGVAYMIMEYRPAPTLRQLVGAGVWRDVARALEQILAALGHAHARGVLHLDLKPENALLERGPDGVQVTLIDFGLARMRGARAGTRAWIEGEDAEGTPAYMAPEQRQGESVSFGPATDLFALGKVAFELCAGRLPVGDERLPARAGVPGEMADWIAWLLAPRPGDRPLCAADALYALRDVCAAATAVQLGAAVAAVDGVDGDAHADNLTRAATAVDPGLAPTGVVGAAVARVSAGARRELDRWRAERAGAALAAAEAPRAAGLDPPPPGTYGTYGLRHLPVLGRREERDAIWTAILDAVRSRSACVVVIQGAPGVGKSHLAQDAVERAAELGLCVALHTRCSPEGAAGEGIRGLVENLLDTRGVDAARLRARLAFWLERIPGDHARYARDVELLLRPLPSSAPDASLPSRVLVETVIRAAALRPVLVWLDDAHWSWHEAGLIVERLLAADLPVCVVATARDTELADAPAWATAGGAGVVRVPMRQLDAAATRSLVRGLLDVEDELCDLIEARAEGVPLFATQFVDQLFRSGAIERAGGRYRLAASVDLATIPAEIGALWERSLERSGADRRCLAALALVREHVAVDIAEHLTATLGPDMDAALARGLAAGLLRIEAGVVAWTHGLLRAHILATISAADRPALHAAAAAALAPLVPREDVQAERAHHLRAAGRLADACDALRDAGLTSQRRADNRARRERFTLLGAWAREAGLPRAAALAAAELARMDAEMGAGDAADAGFARALALLDRADGESRTWVTLRQAQADMVLGRTAAGERGGALALELARAHGVGAVERSALLLLGISAQRAGDATRSRELLAEVARLAGAAGDPAIEAQALWTAATSEPPGVGVAMCERAIQLASSIGALRFEVLGRQVWVDLLWRSGDRARARREARAACADAMRLSLRQTVSSIALQGAMWALGEGDLAEARAQHELAGRWGAESGAEFERVSHRALAILLWMHDGEHERALAAARELQPAMRAYVNHDIRELMMKAAGEAPAALAEVLRGL